MGYQDKLNHRYTIYDFHPQAGQSALVQALTSETFEVRWFRQAPSIYLLWPLANQEEMTDIRSTFPLVATSLSDPEKAHTRLNKWV